MLFFFFWKRREWLQEALSSITEDTYVKSMMTHLQTIDKPETDNDDDILSEKEDAFEGLADIVDNLDNANGVFWFTIWGWGGGGSMFILNKGKKI